MKNSLSRSLSLSLSLSIYILCWPKSSFRVFVMSYGKPQMNFLANPIHVIYLLNQNQQISTQVQFVSSVATLTFLDFILKEIPVSILFYL